MAVVMQPPFIITDDAVMMSQRNFSGKFLSDESFSLSLFSLISRPTSDDVANTHLLLSLSPLTLR